MIWPSALVVAVLVTPRSAATSNVAVTDWLLLFVIVQGPVPEHAPSQPLKIEPASGVAVSVMLVPATKLLWQKAPQSMPVGLLVTLPVPLPAFTTRTGTANVALTFF